MFYSNKVYYESCIFPPKQKRHIVKFVSLLGKYNKTTCLFEADGAVERTEPKLSAEQHGNRTDVLTS